HILLILHRPFLIIFYPFLSAIISILCSYTTLFRSCHNLIDIFERLLIVTPDSGTQTPTTIIDLTGYQILYNLMWHITKCCIQTRSEEHTSELQSRFDLVCRLLLEKKNIILIHSLVR